MTQKIFAILDKKSQCYRFPNFARNEGAAIRSLEVAVSDVQSEIGRFPDDFDLYDLGTFDDEQGYVIPQAKPIFIISAITISRLNAQKAASNEA